MKKVDSYNWIRKIIDSCENTHHTNNTLRLIKHFGRKHNDESMFRDLEKRVYRKSEDIMEENYVINYLNSMNVQ